MVGAHSKIKLTADQAHHILALAVVAGGFTFGDLSKVIGRTPIHTRTLTSHPKTRAYVSQIMSEIADRVIIERVAQLHNNTYSNIPITDTIQQVIAAHTVREAGRVRRRPGQAPGQPAPGKRPGDGQVGSPGQDSAQDQDRQDTQHEGDIEAQ